jgi:hypothetical protein
MNFKAQELKFGFKDRKDYDPAVVIAALEKKGNFKGATELWQK